MTHALIIGAGIAGPVAAMALQRAGIEATLYEAYDRSAEGVGAFLTVAPNGLDALRHIDITAEMLGGFDTSAMVMRNGGGRELARFSTFRARAGLTSRTISRSELYIGLRDEAVRRGVRTVYGKQLIDVDHRHDGGVTATFADGSAAEGDILIGADGLHSRVRGIVAPQTPAPRYTGLLNTGGFAHGVRVDAPPETFTMIFGRKAFFGFQPAGTGEVWWFANVPQRMELSTAELAGWTPDRWRAELLRLFADDAGPATDIIAATEQIVPPWNTVDLPHVPRWASDRAVLIGDAAHAISPTSGQGASLAIEDAVVLATCLRDLPVRTAVSRYERLRRGRVEKLIEQARRTSSMKIPNPLTRMIRDHIVMPIIARKAARTADATDEVQDFRIDWDTRVLA